MYFFLYFLLFFNRGWMVLNGFELSLNAFSKHRQSKPLQTQTNYLLQNSCFQAESNGDPIRAYQKTAVFQSESSEDPIRAYQKTEVVQSESNKDPIRACQKREDLPELVQKPWGMVQISSLLLRIYHPP